MRRIIRKPKRPFGVKHLPAVLIHHASAKREPFYLKVREEQSGEMSRGSEYKENLLLWSKCLACAVLELDGLADYEIEVLERRSDTVNKWFADRLLVRKEAGFKIEYSVLDLTAPEFQKH